MGKPFYLRDNNNKPIVIVILICFGLCLFSCSSGKKGYFGFGKSPREIKAYQIIPVFEANKGIYWVYQLKSLSSPNIFGVKLERNELGWLYLETISLKADKEFKVLSYHYPPMKPGLYKITIFHKMEILDEGFFRMVENQ